jgi:uncharacterized protein (TIGR00251 family)
MKFFLKVKPNSKKIKIEKISQNQFTLWINAPAQNGRANQAAVKALSEYLAIPKSRITIVKGHKTRNKIVELI